MLLFFLLLSLFLSCFSTFLLSFHVAFLSFSFETLLSIHFVGKTHNKL